MRTKLLLLLVAIIPTIVLSQTVERVTITGAIFSESNDVEAVTIYNTSANQGTITDAFGVFTINVALNDIIEISALQFQPVTVVVDEDVVKTKTLKIQLIEQVNQLNAITVKSGLSGNLETDISDVKMVKIEQLDMGNMDALSMSEDKSVDPQVIRDHLTATLNPNALNYLPNFVEIFELFVKIKPKKKNKKVVVDDDNNEEIDVLDIYTVSYLNENFNIPEDKIHDFLKHLETENIDRELFKPKNEIFLLEFLLVESQRFLNTDDKN
ncbi:carboxypeptidase-like regulatory domain-containing protein [Neotamlana laminarinivorans]|uniref:Carboxypeptidase-like regulatory domain-containing protein n=1 Tax=Neotamlana laminarinivorans TaxID=2883124 RepID=A0A9X1I2W0_9FLAO|nr:carboxypeptidase-like regulatory domain-containing protein [Tamlana laminarinivorans]MCB4799638.1 carboxypeptidase-like regulatory domain-containing protein [Tamlana laminarinivorans]